MPFAFRNAAATWRGSFLSTSTWRFSSCIVTLSIAAPTRSMRLDDLRIGGHLEADDGGEIVGREQVLVVVERRELLGRDLPVGGEAVGDVDLLLRQRIVAQPQRRELPELAELDPVDLLHALDAVAPVGEFRAGAELQLRRDLGEVGERLEIHLARRLRPHDDGIAVVHAGRLQPGELELLLVIGPAPSRGSCPDPSRSRLAPSSPR